MIITRGLGGTLLITSGYGSTVTESVYPYCPGASPYKTAITYATDAVSPYTDVTSIFIASIIASSEAESPYSNTESPYTAPTGDTDYSFMDDSDYLFMDGVDFEFNGLSGDAYTGIESPYTESMKYTTPITSPYTPFVYACKPPESLVGEFDYEFMDASDYTFMDGTSYDFK